MAKPRPRAKAAPVTARAPTLRLLPVLIFVAGLMLSVRVGDIWKGLSHLGSLHVATELEAQQPPRGQGPQPPAKAEQPAAATTAAAEPAPLAAAQATPMTPTEMDVLQKLSERRDQLDTREHDIERREALLKAGDDQIDRRIAELKTLQSTIEGLLRQYNDQEDAKIKSLVKIYENMKPKEAAKIFEQLDMPILLDVIERMKEQKVAPILAEMDPSKARTVTSEMAQRRQMPLPKCVPAG
jgi:flagellar motility protein MotE (MotC chaperone)